MKEAELKAKELIERFLALDMLDLDGYTYWIEDRNAKQCALICVNQMLEVLENIPDLDVKGNILLNEIEKHRKIKQILTDKY